jgi:hypothetical protein
MAVFQGISMCNPDRTALLMLPGYRRFSIEVLASPLPWEEDEFEMEPLMKALLQPNASLRQEDK